MNKFVSPHPRASGDGYVVPGGGGTGEAGGLQQPFILKGSF